MPTFPAKTNYAAGDILTAAQMVDVGNGLNDLLPDAKGSLTTVSAANTPAQLTVGSDGSILVADSAATTGLRWQASQAAGKNRIINGAMLIDQRNAGASVTVNSTTSVFPVDRFSGTGQSTDGVYTLQQDSDAPTGFTKSVKVTITTADASIGSTQQYLLRQLVEAGQIFDFNLGKATAKTFTLSFWVRSSLTGTFGGSFRNNDASRSYPFSYTINAANTWEKKSVTLVGDTSGTWLTGLNDNGLNICWSLGSGSDRLGTAGAWNSNNNTGATGQTQVISTLNATWYITGVQLELGSVATDFTLAGGTAGELAACQRYYYRISADTVGSDLAIGQSATTSLSRIVIYNPVTMRIAPTALEQSGTAGDYSIREANAIHTCTDVPLFYTGTKSMQSVTLTATNLLTAGRANSLRAVNTSAYLGWSAEL